MLLQRVNGRVAMLGFAGCALTELSSHASVLEQISHGWGGAAWAMLLVSLGSLVPKLTSGTPLRELHVSTAMCIMSRRSATSVP